jgi:DNA-binding SARP family transcriptional activator
VKAPSLRPPHVERLTERVRALDGPLVQLWAWSGAGQQAVLDALTEDARFGQPLSLDALADESTLRRAVEAAFRGGARWLVLPAVPSLPAASPESAGTIARLLTPGQRLVFSAPRKRPPGPLACSYLLPQEFLLDGGELADLWRSVTGAAPAEALVARLLAATDGWYRPLRLAAEAAAEAGGSVDADALVELPAVASFLRHEVLGLLSPPERDLLVALSAGDGLGGELWDAVLEPAEDALRRGLLEEWGLALEEAGRPRLPTLLRGFLSREREGRWSLARRRGLALRLGRAELAAGRPVRALGHFTDAAERGELDALLAAHWPQLFAAAPLGLLERLVEEPGGREVPDAAALLARLVEVLLWRREGAAGFSGLAAAADADLAAAAGLAAELVAGTGTPPEGSALARDWQALPAPLRPLHALAELRRGAVASGEEDGGGGEGGEAGTAAADDAAAAALLVPALERVEPGPGPRSGAEGGGALRGCSAQQALFERGLLDLLRRRPALAGELGRRRDLPPAWRRWLAGLPPAALASESSGYAVELLGKPSLRLRRPGGRSLELRFPLRRAFQVFAYLASSPGFEATRDELVEAVWCDEDEAAVAKNLHPTLSYVRRTLEGDGETAVPPVVLRRGVYRLNPRLAWNVDVVELARRAEEGRRRLGEGQPEQALSLWQGAWALYRGPFLAGWEAPWIAARRDRFAALHLDLLSSLGEVCERFDRLTEAMDAYRAALIEDPLQERVHLALMRIYARQGRRDLVRRQYERLTALLREDLGVEPLTETTDAYQRLMA